MHCKILQKMPVFGQFGCNLAFLKWVWICYTEKGVL